MKTLEEIYGQYTPPQLVAEPRPQVQPYQYQQYGAGQYINPQTNQQELAEAWDYIFKDSKQQAQPQVQAQQIDTQETQPENYSLLSKLYDIGANAWDQDTLDKIAQEASNVQYVGSLPQEQYVADQVNQLSEINNHAKAQGFTLPIEQQLNSNANNLTPLQQQQREILNAYQAQEIARNAPIRNEIEEGVKTKAINKHSNSANELAKLYRQYKDVEGEIGERDRKLQDSNFLITGANDIAKSIPLMARRTGTQVAYSTAGALAPVPGGTAVGSALGALEGARLGYDTQYGHNYFQALENGTSPEVADIYAKVGGAIEGGLGQIPIMKFGKGGILKSVRNEAAEEASTELMHIINELYHDQNPEFRNAYKNGDYASLATQIAKRAAYAGTIGGVMGGAMHGVAKGSEKAINKAFGKETPEQATDQPIQPADPSTAQGLADNITTNAYTAPERTETQQERKVKANGKALNEILTPFNENEEKYNGYHDDLINDIADGTINESAKQPTEYGRLAKEYLVKTGQYQQEPAQQEQPKQPKVFTGPVIEGTNDEVDIGDNEYQPFTYTLMEADDLDPTVNKSSNQYRDRNRQSSNAQVQNIANNLDPRKVGASPTMDYGSPVIANDNQTIIAGNGRTMAINQAYGLGKAENYRQDLVNKANEYGFSPEQVGQFKKPVLVRKLNNDVDVRKTAIRSNEQGGLRMSSLEQAKVDAERLPDIANIEGDLTNPSNRSYVNQFIQNQPENLRNEYLDSKGQLSQTGVTRLRNAILHKAYGDTDILNRAVESADQQQKNILNALTQVASKVAKTKDSVAQGNLDPNADISQDIINAVDKFNQAKLNGKTIEEYINQQDFVSEMSPTEKQLLRLFGENNRSAKKIATTLNNFYRVAESKANTQQASMFGDVEFNPAEELVNAENIDEDLLSTSEGKSDREVLEDLLGKEVADKIEFVAPDSPMPRGENLKSLVDKGVEGWFNPRTNKIYLVAESIQANGILNRQERLAWVATHELAHAGVKNRFSNLLNNVLNNARSHLLVKGIADKIKKDRANRGLPIDDMVATEEALVELYAAVKTGKWDELENRYGIKIHNSWRTGERSVEPLLNRVAKVLKRLMSQVIGRPITDEEVFTILSGIEKGINTYAKSGRNSQPMGTDVNYSLSELNEIKDKIANFLSRVKKDKTLNEKLPLLPVSSVEVMEAKEHGVNLDGYTHIIDSSAINHIFKKHGNAKAEKARGQLPITDEDIINIQNILNNPDNVIYGIKTRVGRDGVVTITKLPNGSTLVLQEIRSGRKELALTSMRKYPSAVRATSIMKSLDLNVRNDSDGSDISIVSNPKKRNSDVKFSTAWDSHSSSNEKFSTSQETSSQDLVAKAIDEGKTLKEIQEDKNILRAVAKDIEPEYEEFLNSDSNHKLMKNMRRRFLNAWKNDDFSRENGSHVLEGIIKEHYNGHKESNPTTNDLVQKAVDERREITSLRADEKFLDDFADALTRENNKVIASDTSTDTEKKVAKYYNEWLAKDSTIDNSYLIKEIENRYYKAETERAKAKPKEVVKEKAPIVEEKPKRRFNENASPKELDKQYFKALNDGDNELAQQVVDFMAEKKGYDTSDNFRKDHQAPSSKTDDPNALNMMEHDLIPNDHWESPDYYRTQEDIQTFYTVKRFLDRVEKYKRGELDKMPRMIVYRAVPKDLKESEIRNGDWVTPSLDYAKFHGATNVGKYRIIKKAIPADQVYWNGDSIQEWGVDDSKSYAYKNTKNNRKLADLETRDDDGEIIPPSKRFNSRKDDIRFSVSEDKNLLVAHNLTPEGIIKAHELGGLAAPSIAVVRSDVSDFGKFGDISLLADPKLLEDKKIRTFDADVYSPRQPRAEYAVDQDLFREFEETLEKIKGIESIVQRNIELKGAEYLLESPIMQYNYLKEVGKLPAIPKIKTSKYVKLAANAGKWDPLPYAEKHYRSLIEEERKVDEFEADSLESAMFRDGKLSDGHLNSFIRDVYKYKNDGEGVDLNKFKSKMEDKISSRATAKAFKDWVIDKLNGMVVGQNIKGTDTPYNLDNVVEMMTQRLVNGEETHYGEGNVRANYAKEFKTLKEIKAKRNKIISPSDFEQIREDTKSMYQETLEKLKPFYKGHVNSFTYTDSAGKALAGGDQAIAEQFKLTKESKKIIGDFINYLKEIPTEYFEAKAQRAVDFSEFKVAVVPKGTDPKAVKILRDAGLKIKRYDQNIEGDKQRVINTQDDIKFSVAEKANKDYKRDLVVTHNISADGIIHADKMGGLPFASIAVTKQDNPLTGFGEVTLIGDRNYIDPKGENKAKVFGSDIYSPRYPNVRYKIKTKDLVKLYKTFSNTAREINDTSFDYHFSEDNILDKGVRNTLLNSEAVKYQFLKDEGVAPDVIYKKAELKGFNSKVIELAENNSEITDEVIKDYAQGRIDSLTATKKRGIAHYTEKNYPADKIDAYIERMNNSINDYQKVIDGDLDQIEEVRFELNANIEAIEKRLSSEPTIDNVATLKAINEKVKEREDGFISYVDDIADDVDQKEMLYNGTNSRGAPTYQKHTLENVVKKLKKDLRGGENATYNIGSLRGKVTPKFKSIEDIQRNKDRLVGSEDFERVKGEVSREIEDSGERLDLNLDETLELLDDVIDNGVPKAFKNQGVDNTPKNRNIIKDILAKLENMPTEYFEGKAKEVTQFSDFKGAVIPDNLKGKARKILENAGLKLFDYKAGDQDSRAKAIKSATNKLDEESGDVLFSTVGKVEKQSASDLAKTGKAIEDESLFNTLKSKDGRKSLFNKVTSTLDEHITDALRPVNDWMKDSVAPIVGEVETQNLQADMYLAKGKRDTLVKDIENRFLKPLLGSLAKVSKKYKLDELTTKRLVGYWASARYSIDKNLQLLEREKQAMDDAEKEYQDIRLQYDLENQNGNVSDETQALLDNADNEYRKAKRQYEYRKHDVELGLDSDEKFKVGTAGGWSIAQAKQIMRDIEKHISKDDLLNTTKHLYRLNQHRLDIDRAAGRYTEEQYREMKLNKHYVPLTGDPNGDVFDSITGAGDKAVNVSKDKALKGRKNSEAEDAIDASWKGISNSATYAGWSDFKQDIDDIYQTEFDRLIDEGMTDKQAKEEIKETLGITKSRMLGVTRPSDNVLIRKHGGVYYQYELPPKVIRALKNDNVETLNAFWDLLAKPTRLYARGVTQWKVHFAPMNMLRDLWEKSEFVRVQKIYDKNGKLVDSKTLDKIGRDTIRNALTPTRGVLNATRKFALGKGDTSTPEGKMLQDLIDFGGVSTYRTYLDHTEKDLIKKVKKENGTFAKRLDQAGNIIEGYNAGFDLVSSLASYKALVENGVAPKQAAAVTLELTNFRKQGASMKPVKALYMFAQPTAMGGRNLAKYLSTPKGRKRFLGYMVAMSAMYAMLNSFTDDEDDLDLLGDITRYIPIPTGDGEFIKIPVGFGMPQLAWNFSVNMSRLATGAITPSEAISNMSEQVVRSGFPVSPSSISASEDPLAKFVLTVTPSTLQPVVQNALNKNAFGSSIHSNFGNNNKVRADQGKASTPEFWKDASHFVLDNFGMNIYPEDMQNIARGYAGMLGSLSDIQTLLIDNPNREKLGRPTRTPIFNQLYGSSNVYAIPNLYYQASEEARGLANRVKSQTERGLKPKLTPLEQKELKWFKVADRQEKAKRSYKSKLTRRLNSKKLSQAKYDELLTNKRKQMEVLQKNLLNSWREMHDLKTY